MDFGIATVVAITVLVFVIGLAVKATKIDNKWIPVICGVAGIILGIVALATGMPDFPATDYALKMQAEAAAVCGNSPG